MKVWEEGATLLVNFFDIISIDLIATSLEIHTQYSSNAGIASLYVALFDYYNDSFKWS
jgi:hypothetical protein